MANEEHLAKLREGAKAWNQWRADNPDLRPDLRGADLNGDVLTNADLSFTDLCGADLIGANLSNADLSFADLSKACLCSTDLRSAYLRGANLSYADLRFSDLSAAALCFANLGDADLDGAIYDSATQWPEGYTDEMLIDKGAIKEEDDNG